MKLFIYLIEAYDDNNGYLQQCVHAISEQEAETIFLADCTRRKESFEVVEITKLK